MGDLLRNKTEQSFACHNANRHLELYLKTGDGLLIWQAYQEFRKRNLPVPEEILKKLDEFASALSKASGNKGIAEAVEMAVHGGGASGYRRTVAKDGQRDIVEFVHNARKYSKKSPGDIHKEAAEKFNTTQKRVENLYSDWMKEINESVTDESIINDFLYKPKK